MNKLHEDDCTHWYHGSSVTEKRCRLELCKKLILCVTMLQLFLLQLFSVAPLPAIESLKFCEWKNLGETGKKPTKTQKTKTKNPNKPNT